MSPSKKRIISLDVLRAVAIILVEIRHGEIHDILLYKFGWLGVDLFFVLSGFLVSGILFKEYQSTNKIKGKRFFFRRAYKVFPPFYFFLITTIILELLFTSPHYKLREILSELFYLQSYIPRTWLHTWTLAVEEHFYLIVLFTTLLLVKKNLLRHRVLMISSLIAILFISFLIRYDLTSKHGVNQFYAFIYTHARADGIIVGVLLSYLYYFTNSFNFFRRLKIVFLLLGVILIMPGFFHEGGYFFMNVYGLTTVNLGFGAILIFSLSIEAKLIKLNKNRLFKLGLKAFTIIGVHSYSIYLWHFNCKRLTYAIFTNTNEYLVLTIYILTSIFVGILLSKLIEMPFERLKNKKWS